MNLSILVQMGITPQKILDIGANVGNFSMMCKSIWPTSECTLIEANSECNESLEKLKMKFFNVLVGKESNEKVQFYKNIQSKCCTGNSIHRELTKHYEGENFTIESLPMTTLDLLFPNDFFDLIKIDTQGSEVDILMGGQHLVKKAKYIILEVSLIQYNENSPLFESVLKYMSSIGFCNHLLLDNHFVNNVLIQQDYAFFQN